VCNLERKKTQKMNKKEISRLSRRQNPFKLQHSDGDQLPTTAETAFDVPIIPTAIISVKLTGSSERALKQ
jgi:hypothetical protein